MAFRRSNADGIAPFDSADAATEGVETLYRQYRNSIRRRIANCFGSGPPDPEDAVQAAFERYAMLDDPSQVRDPQAFLIRSAVNFVFDHRRRMKVRSAHADQEFFLADRTDDHDAGRVLSARERLAILDMAIKGMDERRREILVMNRIHGISCADIARRLNRSPTLVKMLLAEAIVLCRQALREADAE